MSKNWFNSVDCNMSVYCTHSESQKKMLSSNIHKKLDVISSSSASPSDLGRQGRESAKIQVNTHSPSPCRQATEDTSVGLLSPLRWHCILEGCAQIPIQEWLLCLCCGPSSPVGVFDYFFKCIWTITADYP